jgi:hypothetical protein
MYSLNFTERPLSVGRFLKQRVRNANPSLSSCKIKISLISWFTIEVKIPVSIKRDKLKLQTISPKNHFFFIFQNFLLSFPN